MLVDDVHLTNLVDFVVGAVLIDTYSIDPQHSISLPEPDIEQRLLEVTSDRIPLAIDSDEV
jgi:hypothetical protein